MPAQGICLHILPRSLRGYTNGGTCASHPTTRRHALRRHALGGENATRRAVGESPRRAVGAACRAATPAVARPDGRTSTDHAPTIEVVVANVPGRWACTSHCTSHTKPRSIVGVFRCRGEACLAHRPWPILQQPTQVWSHCTSHCTSRARSCAAGLCGCGEHTQHETRYRSWSISADAQAPAACAGRRLPRPHTPIAHRGLVPRHTAPRWRPPMMPVASVRESGRSTRRHRARSPAR